MSLGDRVDRLDESLVEQIQTGARRRGIAARLLALHAAVAARGDFSCLEVGSYHGASLQSFIADPRCREVVSIDRRDEASPDTRAEAAQYPENTTAHMFRRLSELPGADLDKLTTTEATTEDLNPAALSADLCFIDAEHTNPAVLQDARFWRRVVRDRGIPVFHDNGVGRVRNTDRALG